MNNLFFAHQKSLDATRRQAMQTFLMLKNKSEIFNSNDTQYAAALVKICDSIVFTSYDDGKLASDVAQYVQTHLDHKGRNARCSEILFRGETYILKPVRSLDGYTILSPEDTLARNKHSKPHYI